MMLRFALRSLPIALGLLLSSCATATRPIAAPPANDATMWYSDSYEVSCDVVGVEGVQVLRVSTIGRNENFALIEGRRAAVQAILFRGVRSTVCQVPALVPRERMTDAAHQEFLKMFRDGGPYLNFVVGSGDSVLDVVRLPDRLVKVTSAVTVDRNALARHLESEGIITGMGDIFRRRE